MADRVTALSRERDDYGVYSSRGRGPFGTPLMFRGTLDEVLRFRELGSKRPSLPEVASEHAPPLAPGQSRRTREETEEFNEMYYRFADDPAHHLRRASASSS